jgi:hypothetical protein
MEDSEGLQSPTRHTESQPENVQKVDHITDFRMNDRGKPEFGGLLGALRLSDDERPALAAICCAVATIFRFFF